MYRLIGTSAISKVQLSDLVYIEMIAMLYSSLAPIVMLGSMITGLGLLIALVEKDIVIGAIACASALNMGGRAANIAFYRKKIAKELLTRRAAEIWEWRHNFGTVANGIILGMFSERALLAGDPLLYMPVTFLIFTFGTVLIVRTAVRPVIFLISFSFAVLPMFVIASLYMGMNDWSSGALYGAQILILIGTILTGCEMSLHKYQNSIEILSMKSELARLAHQDALTGLPNRAQLQAQFMANTENLKGSDKILAVHCLDLDRFKNVNDTFGHPAGDALLKTVGARLARTLRSEDTAARLGGDEFIVLQTGLSSPSDAIELAGRIIAALSAPYSLDGGEAHIGVSIGLAFYPRDGEDLDQIIASADNALYEAKSSQRGTAKIFGSGTSATGQALAAQCAELASNDA